MLERERLESKKISKTNAVTSQLGHRCRTNNVHVGPSDYVPWLEDRKWCYIRMEGTTFGNVPLKLRSEAGSVGFAKFRRRGDRCRPLRQTRHGPGHRRRVGRAVQLLHEIATATIHRLRGPAANGGLYCNETRKNDDRSNQAVERAEQPVSLGFSEDPGWKEFSEMMRMAAMAIKELCPKLPLVLGGISPIDPNFISLLKSYRPAGSSGCGGGPRVSAGLEPLAN